MNNDPKEPDGAVHHAGTLARDILDMLEIDGSDAVPPWYAGWVAEQCTGGSTRLLRIQPKNASRQKAGMAEDFWITEDRPSDDPRPVTDDPELLEALRFGLSTQLESPHGVRSAFMLHAADELRYAIDVVAEGTAFTPRSLELWEIAQAYFQRLVHLETDPLTRLRNRRTFQRQVDSNIRHWARSEQEHYLAMLDIDHFKRVNDDFGHLYGDEILVLFAQLMKRTFRAADVLYRFGGEEFVVIYGAERGHSGLAAPERFRAAVEATVFPGVGRVTVSGGFTRVKDVATPSSILVERADEAMYYAKTHGRNRVCGWEQLVAAGELADRPVASKDVTLF